MIILARLKDAKDEIIGNLDPQYLVEKSDPLFLMRSVPFSLGELKILDTYISRINADDDSRRTVIFTKAEYEELMGLTEANSKALSKHTDNLLGKVVTLQMPNKDFLKFVLFTKAYYHKDEYGVPIIELTCSPEAKDLFFCIGKYHYFHYALENVINLTHKASYLLYIHILSNRFRKEWTVELTELRDTILDCKGQESYREYKIFKNRVLDPAVKEVNAKTDCKFEYTPIKRGRCIVQIKFNYFSEEIDPNQITFDELPQQQQPSLSADDEERIAASYGDENLAILAEGCRYEFNKEQMEQIQLILTRIDIPKDRNLSGYSAVVYGRQHYLREKYAALNAEVEKKQRKGNKPIKDRFKYFVSMLERDTFEPAAYK